MEHKGRIESFHVVTFDDTAVRAAVSLASRRGSTGGSVLARALDLLDSAGARLRISHGEMPKEVRELQKRITFIAARMERAIYDHEFEKARFYSDEERKERENLRVLRQQLGLDQPPGIITVTSHDIELDQEQRLL